MEQEYSDTDKPPTIRWGSVNVSTDTPFGKELLKWERKPGYDPKNHPFPKMMYKAQKLSNGEIKCQDSEPSPYGYADMGMHDRAMQAVHRFNTGNQLTVHSPEEYKTARANGWRDNPKEAEDQQWAYQHDMQQAHAEREHADRGMSDAAKKEARVAVLSTSDFVPEIAEKPRVKRAYNRKQVA